VRASGAFVDSTGANVCAGASTKLEMLDAVPLTTLWIPGAPILLDLEADLPRFFVENNVLDSSGTALIIQYEVSGMS
jgi:hypothetical protein